MPTTQIVVAVTGGAGFIGSAVCRHLASDNRYRVVNIDKLTYAGNLESVSVVAHQSNYAFYQKDICNTAELLEIFKAEHVSAILHLAAESHVDRSISGAQVFVETNVVGTYSVLEAALAYWRQLAEPRKDTFRLISISTDEVYGTLTADDPAFKETTPYDPSSPYAASKAAADHLALAWFKTYGLPVVVTNCSNNYGPYHFPEKLIPLTILNAIDGKALPVYGTGENIRDWLFVEDHADALQTVLRLGRPGEKYNIGGNSEIKNIDVVRTICTLLDELSPRSDGLPYCNQIEFVTDRPGHDFRYAIDCRKIGSELGWTPRESFSSGIRKTVEWYLQNDWWWRPIRENKYSGERLGLNTAAVPSNSIRGLVE